jgi:hypothetical protein
VKEGLGGTLQASFKVVNKQSTTETHATLDSDGQMHGISTVKLPGDEKRQHSFRWKAIDFGTVKRVSIE